MMAQIIAVISMFSRDIKDYCEFKVNQGNRVRTYFKINKQIIIIR